MHGISDTSNFFYQTTNYIIFINFARCKKDVWIKCPVLCFYQVLKHSRVEFYIFLEFYVFTATSLAALYIHYNAMWTGHDNL